MAERALAAAVGFHVLVHEERYQGSCLREVGRAVDLRDNRNLVGLERHIPPGLRRRLPGSRCRGHPAGVRDRSGRGNPFHQGHLAGELLHVPRVGGAAADLHRIVQGLPLAGFDSVRVRSGLPRHRVRERGRGEFPLAVVLRIDGSRDFSASRSSGGRRHWANQVRPGVSRS